MSKRPVVHIVFIICANGLGHFKRSIGLSFAIKQRFESYKLDLICTSQQLRLTKDWTKVKYLLSKPDVCFHTDSLTSISPITKEKRQYQDGRLINWVSCSNKNDFILKADLVISDNLVGILNIRKDSILMGSFLWIDIFEPQHTCSLESRRILNREKELLLEYNPPMLCVDQIAMPNIKKLTQDIRFPFFAQERKKRRTFTTLNKKIAILAGASQISDKLVLNLLSYFKRDDLQIYIPKRLFDLMEPMISIKVKPFTFSIDDYRECDLIICRPGVGTITDCISAQTPMLLFYEANNKEMVFNSERLVEMGIAIQGGISPSIEVLLDNVRRIYDLSILQAMSKRMYDIPTNGFEKAIDWLEENEYLK